MDRIDHVDFTYCLTGFGEEILCASRGMSFSGGGVAQFSSASQPLSSHNLAAVGVLAEGARLCSDRVASGPLAGPSEQGHIVPTWSNAARVATALPNRGLRPRGPTWAVGAPMLGRYVTNLNLVTRFHTCIWISFS